MPILFVACALAGVGRIAWRHFAVERGVRWGRIDPRYAPLRPLLNGLREVGYVTDRRLNVRPSDTGDADATALYQQAQYSLAPVVLHLDDTTASQLVVGNFLDPASAPKIAAERRLRAVRDFGAGLVLFEAAR